jgi:uncharacterized phosphosugar-binding protein
MELFRNSGTLVAVLPIIIATMILHNISIDVNEDDRIEDAEVDISDFDEPDDIFNVEIINNNENRAVPTALINTIFNR